MASVLDPLVADSLTYCAAALGFKLFLVHFLTSRTRMMLDDPYGKQDWAKTTTSPLFTFWKMTLVAWPRLWRRGFRRCDRAPREELCGIRALLDGPRHRPGHHPGH